MSSRKRTVALEIKLKNQQLKANFRLDWACRRTATFMQKYEHVIKETTSDGSVGTYVPFKILWDREGNDQAGYEAPSELTESETRVH